MMENYIIDINIDKELDKMGGEGGHDVDNQDDHKDHDDHDHDGGLDASSNGGQRRRKKRTFASSLNSTGDD